MKTHGNLLRVMLVAISVSFAQGCASHYTIEETEIVNGKGEVIARPTGDDIKMPKALGYSGGLKEGALNNAKRQFNIGQSMNGALIGAASAATALLAFDGNQTAAAAVGLGAGVLGITDRFLLIDESLGIYNNAIQALTCGENLLSDLASHPADPAKLSEAAEDVINLAKNASFDDISKTLNLSFTVAPNVNTQAIFTPLAAQIFEAAEATRDLNDALIAASDAGPDKDERAAARLILLVDQVRQSVNTTILAKKMTVEEIVAAFDKTVGDYIKKIEALKKAAEEKNKKADAVKEATLITAAHFNATGQTAFTTSDLTKTSHATETLDVALESVAKDLPTSEDINKCLLIISGAKPAEPKPNPGT